MSDQTDVVNVALRQIGAARITSLTDGSNEATTANDLWGEALDDVLRSHNWNFATRRQKLAAAANAPAYEFDYAYPVPSDWVRTVSVHDNDGGDGTITFREEYQDGVRCILASSTDLYLRYVARITNVGLMPPDFRRALAMHLAMDMAIPLANSAIVLQTMQGLYERALTKAMSADARGASPESRPPGSWISTRASWPGRTSF